MRKIIIERPGGFESLKVVNAPEPVVGPGEITISVAAAGVNFADCIARMGLYAPVAKFAGWPLTPGFEVSGRVAALGSGITDFDIGVPVVALTRFGGYAEKLVVPRSQVFRRPARFSAVEGAAFPVAFLTAKYAVDLASPPSTSCVLIHSAAGGVGSALVQISRMRGNYVVGVVGNTSKIDIAVAAGADAVIDRSREHWPSAARKLSAAGYRAIYDASGEDLRADYDLLSLQGRLVVYGSHHIISKRGSISAVPGIIFRYFALPRFNPLRLTSDNKSIMGFNLVHLFHEKDMLASSVNEIMSALLSGKLSFPNITTFPLEQAPEAHRALQSGATSGKCVLTIGTTGGR
jgi:NADPH:quinone reductase-like Zn-dependent oxidoreductase